MNIYTSDEEDYINIQLFGSEAAIMAEGAVMASEYGAKIIDINMGCPVPKVVKNGEGSALMQNPPLACDIVSAMKKAVKYIFGEINGSEGFLIASKLA